MLVPFLYSVKREKEGTKWEEWYSLAKQLTPLLMEYHARHPERFKYVGPDTEEVSIDGFEEYVVGKNPNLSTTFHKGRRRLRDPWDDPVCFVMSRGDNEKIVARGMRSYMLIGGSGGLHYNPFGLGIVRFACKAEERNELGPTPIIVFRNSRAVGGK